MEKENDQKHSETRLKKNTRCSVEVTFMESTYKPKKKYSTKAEKNSMENSSGRDIAGTSRLRIPLPISIIGQDTKLLSAL
jgi:hypothetical protein